MRSGDPCPKCSSGRLVAYATKATAGKAYAKRYLHCNVCGATGGKQIVPRAPRVTLAELKRDYQVAGKAELCNPISTLD